MKESLREELTALALYLKTSGADAETKIEYGVSKIELLVKKYSGELGDESRAGD